MWEGVLATVGYAAGSRAALVDGEWVDLGRVVPDQLPRARRLAALRTRTLLRQEFGDVETARTVLTRLVGLLAQLDADKVQEDAEEEPARRKAKKRAARRPPGDPTG